MTKEWGNTIVVGTAGHVWIAESVLYDGTFYNLMNARIIRSWGTTSGLNQLINGPTKSTTIDAAAPVVTVVSSAMIALIPCSEGKWKF
jgi:hypothetical protein